MDSDAGTTRYRLRAFGGLSIEAADGAPLSDFAAQRKAMALLALLARAGTQGLARDRVLAYLWPESDTEQARNALYNLLFRLRRALGAESIVGTAELRLDPTRISSDVAEFELAVAGGVLESAARLYGGPFLDGFYLRDAPEFERWSADERARLARAHIDVLEQLAAGAQQAGDLTGAAHWWRKRTEADPLSARAARGYVEALVAAGDREAALSFIATHSALVRSELGADPDPELLRRADQLRRAPAATSLAGVPTSESSTLSVVASPPIDQLSLPAGARRTRNPWPKRRYAIGIAIGCAVLTVAFAAKRATETALDPRRVLVATFDNRTGDTTLNAFGRIAADGITQQLVRSGIVEVVDPVTSLAASRLVRDSIAQLESRPALRMLARETRAGLVVSGSYSRDGEDIVVQARVTDTRSGEVLAAAGPIRAADTARAALVDAVRQRVMGALALKLDERLATIMPAGYAPTYESYEAFITGLEIFTTGHLAESAPYFAHAYALDTTFAEPLIWEAFAVGSRARRDTIVQTLERHRADLNQLDRYAVDFHRAFLSGTLEDRLVAARNAARLAPGSHWTHNVASTLAALGRTREAIRVWATIDREHGWVRSWPGFWMGYIRALHVAGDHREELEAAREARRVLPANYTLQEYEAIALAVNQRWDELEQRLGAIEQRTNAGWILRFVASELHLHGDDARAHDVGARSVRWYADRALHVPMDAGFRADRAQSLYAAGRWADARAAIDSLRSEHPTNPQWVIMSALVEARVGDRTKAAAVLDSLAGSNPGPTQDMALTGAARIAAVLGRRERAVQLLQTLREHPINYWRHYSFNAIDFDSLVGFPQYERSIAER